MEFGPPELDGLIALRSCRWMYRHSAKLRARRRDVVCQADGALYGDVCPSWSPVDGCVCAKHGYPEHRSPLTDVGAAEANQDQREPVS